MLKLREKPAVFGGLLFLLLAAFFADLLLGSVKIPVRDVLHILSGDRSAAEEWRTIIFDFRFPRSLTAVLSGVALSVSGLQMQTLFRNPLAGPYVLGISSGASLGVALLVMGSSVFLKSSGGSPGTWSIIAAAWIGSGGVMLLILAVSLRIRDVMTILIMGILFGSITIAIVSILQYFSNEAMLKTFIVWTLGSLANVTRPQLPVLGGCVATGLLLSFLSVKVLNALLLGENYARSIGISIQTGRILLFLSTSILAGTVTAFCGPVGFIGIAVPHISRLVFQSADHKILLPAVMLTGAVMMLLSDMISQLPGFDRVLPVNSVTALLGIPVVIWIVVKNQRFTALT